MKNSFKQINEAIDNLYVILKDSGGMPLLEKDVLLGRVRELYVEMQSLKVEEIKTQHIEQQQTEQTNYDVFQGMDDDVDLFFDTEHDSYTQSIPEPNNDSERKEEREEQQQTDPVEHQVDEAAATAQTHEVSNQAEENEPEMDGEEGEEAEALSVEPEVASMAEQTEPADEPVAVAEPEQSKAKQDQTPELDFGTDQDDVAELFSQSYRPETYKAPSKPDEMITPEPLMADDEDDLLQFVPQRFEPKKTEQPTARPEQASKPRSLNDLFMEHKEDRSLGFQYQHAKVGDLTKAISINEKFTFIKELFNNHGEEFSAAIQQLNQCANMDEAFDQLETLKQKYFWDSASTAYLSLCDLLRRKFM